MLNDEHAACHWFVKFARNQALGNDQVILRAEFLYYKALQHLGIDTVATAELDLKEAEKPSLWMKRFDRRIGTSGVERLAVLVADPVFCRPVRMVAAALERAALAPADPMLARRLARLHGTLGTRMARLRRSVLLREHVGLVSPPDLFALTDALRWLERVLFHTERIVHYGAAAAAAAPPKDEAASRLAED